MGKKYFLVEEDSGADGCLALIAIGIVIVFILQFAHILLSILLGFCGFLVAKHIAETTPSSKHGDHLGIYAACLFIFGGFGYWGGRTDQNICED